MTVSGAEHCAVDLMQGLLPQPQPATETAANQTQTLEEAQSGAPVFFCFDITQQGSIYHVSLDVGQFCVYSDMGRAFLLWLYARENTDTIYLTVASDYELINVAGWMDNNATLFQALEQCSATIIGCIDNVVMGQDVYVYMTCDKLKFGPFATLLITPLWSGSSNNRSSDQNVSLNFIHTVFKNAVNLQLLTEDEVTKLCDGQTITLNLQNFSDASFEHLSFCQDR